MTTQSERSNKYNSKNTKAIHIRINKNTDPEIIEWMEDQENVADSIRTLIKNSLRDKHDLDQINLIDYPWIKVIMEDGSNKELSLIEVFKSAHKIISLGGENQAQDFAVLRILIALVQAIYFHDGADKSKWSQLLQQEKFDQTAENYLKENSRSFYLLGEGRRYLQSSAGKRGSQFKLSKLTSMESTNKSRIFQETSGIGKKYIDFGYAARQLTFLYFFDDCSVRKADKSKGTIGSGLCGKIAPIWVEGSNLFETLMYNAIQSGTGSNIPVWEQEEKSTERELVDSPSDQAGKLTFQSRRLWLSDDGFKVSGFYDLGGDYTDPADDPFTLKKDGFPIKYRSDASIRKYAKILESADVIKWIKQAGIVPQSINIAGVIYDPMGSSIVDLISDTISGLPDTKIIKESDVALSAVVGFSDAIKPYHPKDMKCFEIMLDEEFRNACSGMPYDFKNLANEFINESVKMLPPKAQIKAIKSAEMFKLK